MTLINTIKESVTNMMHPNHLTGPVPPPQAVASSIKGLLKGLSPALVLKNMSMARSLGIKAPSTLPSDRRQSILDIAHQNAGTHYQWGGESASGMDCSHFVHHVYQEAGVAYPYTTTHGDWQQSGFTKTNQPQRGDIIMWNGHMGIIVDPDKKTFIGAQKSTGVAEASYATGRYWGNRAHTFLRKSL